MEQSEFYRPNGASRELTGFDAEVSMSDCPDIFSGELARSERAGSPYDRADGGVPGAPQHTIDAHRLTTGAPGVDATLYTEQDHPARQTTSGTVDGRLARTEGDISDVRIDGGLSEQARASDGLPKDVTVEADVVEDGEVADATTGRHRGPAVDIVRPGRVWPDKHAGAVAQPAAERRGEVQEYKGRPRRFRRDTPIDIGEVVNTTGTRGELRVRPDKIKHVVISGFSGGGKTNTAKGLAREFLKRGESVELLTRAKPDEWYGVPAGLNCEVEIVDGDPRRVPLSSNPLSPVPGYPMGPHIMGVVGMMAATAAKGEESSLFTNVSGQIMRLIGQRHGWDMVTGGRAPGRRTVSSSGSFDEAEELLDEVLAGQYGAEVRQNVRGFVGRRLAPFREGKLAAVAGRLGHPMDHRLVVGENKFSITNYEGLGSVEDTDFASGLHLQLLAEQIWVLNAEERRQAALEGRGFQSRPMWKRLIIEEAHRFLDPNSPFIMQMMDQLAAECRAAGIGLLFIEQDPSKLPLSIIKNANTFIAFGTPHTADRQTLVAAMNYPPGSEEDAMYRLGSSSVGEAEVYIRDVTRLPVHVKFPRVSEAERIVDSYERPKDLETRRSMACGRLCMNAACSLETINASEHFASAEHRVAAIDARTWLTLLTWQLMTNQPVGAPQQALRDYLTTLEPADAECQITSVIDGLMRGRRSASLEKLEGENVRSADVTTQFISQVAHGLLTGYVHAGERMGPDYVPPQLQWLHEMEKISPVRGDELGFAYADEDLAPALDYELSGIPLGGTVAERREALLNHPEWSMRHAHNRQAVLNLLFGNDRGRRFIADLKARYVGLGWEQRFRELDREMGISPEHYARPSTMYTVFSWIGRFITPFAKLDNSQQQQARKV